MTSLGEPCVTSVPYMARGNNADQGSEFDTHAGDCSRVSNTRTPLFLPLTYASSLALLTCELFAVSMWFA